MEIAVLGEGVYILFMFLLMPRPLGRVHEMKCQNMLFDIVQVCFAPFVKSQPAKV